VLTWIVAGKRDSEIAVVLGVRPATATTHVRNLLAKLGVESRLVAAMAAVDEPYTRA
jgi:LuxR family transcriptional regulator/LuxR family quorum sensing-dependent transcriptional regulator/LuxR family quorum-sensing system transcriptional regulator CciR